MAQGDGTEAWQQQVMPASPMQSPVSGGRRPCIAVLLDRMNLFAGGFEEEIRNAAHAKGCEYDVDILLAYGRELDASRPEEAGHNAIYDRLKSDRVDALIVFSTSLSPRGSSEELARYLRRFAPVPLVSIGIELPGIPSVLVDGYPGMIAVVEHLVQVHGRRRIVFIGGVPGNPESESRLKAYLEVLQRESVPADPTLITHGYFARDRGESAMRQIIERGTAFDAVVAANDTMAFGAMAALRSAGRKIAREVSVTGFDDVLFAKTCNPPLTTVSQNFAGLIGAALRLALDQCRGQPVPQTTTLIPELVIRGSCGCTGKTRAAELEGLSLQGSPIVELIHDGQVALEQSIGATLREGYRDVAPAASQLVAALEREARGESGTFLSQLDAMVQEAPESSARILAVHRAVSHLRSALRHASTPDLEDLWHEARDFLAVAASAGHVQYALELHAIILSVLTSSERLSGVLDREVLSRTCLECLALAGIRTARVTEFIDGDLGKPRALVLVHEGESVDAGPSDSAECELFPPQATAARSTSLVFPLAFEGKFRGVASFAYDPKIRWHQLIRDQIASALKHVILYQVVIEKTLLHERSVQERVATAQRLEALSLLAGSVAHDLNNALGPLKMQSEMIIRDLGVGESGGPINVSSLRENAKRIILSSQRAARIVTDLLTLGRQGRRSQSPVDLSAIARGCFGGESDDSDEVRLLCDFTREPLVIRGAESQIARAMTNLVHNAIEASPAGGQVSVSTHLVSLPQNLAAYELVDAGTYAVFSVADAGCGISAPLLPRIFEPYFSNKPMGVASGTGLGLAIVHAVVKEHSGFVDVQSEVYKGTTFHLYFPIDEA
jgi:sigma-B regulation protein RsbU (phosphoserine phosphatase)